MITEYAILAFDLQGRKLWETPVGPLADPRHRTLASSCNASPATDGQAVYAQFKSGHFAAVSLEGKILVPRYFQWVSGTVG